MILTGVYKHFKGNRYEVLGLAREEGRSGGELLVLYRQLYPPFSLWLRPQALFFAPKEEGGKSISRFSFREGEKSPLPFPSFPAPAWHSETEESFRISPPGPDGVYAAKKEPAP